MLTPSGTRQFGEAVVPRGATVLELLFDIVYVFALARLAGRVADDLTIVRHTLLSEAGQTVLFFVAMWMIWSLNALMASIYDPRRADIQVALLATMFGTLVLAVTLPQAFGERGLIFCVTYVVVQVGRPLYLTLALRRQDEWRQPARVLAWHGVSGIFWLVGGAFSGLGRGVLWTVALAIEVLGSALSWPFPRLGMTRHGYTRVDYDHLAERYNQFFMIALAEIVLETGAAVSFPGFSLMRSIVLVAAFVIVVAFWRIYFYHVGSGRPRDSVTSGAALRVTHWSSFSLLLIVGGVICTAVGLGQVVEHPDPPIDWALVVVIFGGPALFLIGRFYLESPRRERCLAMSLGLPALGVAALVVLRLPPFAAAVAVATILAGVAVADWLIHRRGPETNPPL
ncbi:low temperature requirement protein A [Micromonospora krabiensis]|uniref:Low temperature requirement protein LtrA n=1 Tax=Micromonospora krabiensis TaxID=307121 RepID=A0A1C3N2Z2_9ACTN|nr:low temperature requirement protein A [Micromonospora krabiensis]SBV26937.1 Low temperature requirement protein LtrA [Micromonospora krabiensis]